MSLRRTTDRTFAILLPKKFLVLLGSTSKPPHPVTVLFVRKAVAAGILTLRERREFVHHLSSSTALADSLAILDSLVLHPVGAMLD
jgi:hypothetical protein